MIKNLCSLLLYKNNLYKLYNDLCNNKENTLNKQIYINDNLVKAVHFDFLLCQLILKDILNDWYYEFIFDSTGPYVKIESVRKFNYDLKQSELLKEEPLTLLEIQDLFMILNEVSEFGFRRPFTQHSSFSFENHNFKFIEYKEYDFYIYQYNNIFYKCPIDDNLFSDCYIQADKITEVKRKRKIVYVWEE